MDALFQIEEIGLPAAPHSGLPGACELCGHCLMLRLLAEQRKAAQSGCIAGGANPDLPNFDSPR